MTYTYNPSNNITINSGATVGGLIGSGSGGSTITLTGAGTSGQYITVGSGGSSTSATTYTTSWATPNHNFHDGNIPVMTIPHGSKTIEIDKAATLDVKGNVKINGVDLEERLKTIETLLHIPTRDVTMENKYPKLKKLYEQYMHELEKYKTWERVKGEDE